VKQAPTHLRRERSAVVRAFVLTSVAMTAFACNSILCRLALGGGSIDAASFTTIRLVAGAAALWLIVRWRSRGGAPAAHGDWWSALALFAYAATFSFAYLSLTAATGALLLFGAVQSTMIGSGFRHGERLDRWQLLGLLLALCGLVGLLAPGVTAPPLDGALLMIAAGVSWGLYSLRGKRLRREPTTATAGNFLRAVPFAVALSLVAGVSRVDPAGVAYAVVSGALASGVGYAIWYAALPAMRATTAATVQLSVPVLTALAGLSLLGEQFTLRLVVASIAILGGIALVTATPRRS
jgi:drug/metabolite transporter (DMT)-like permease